MRKEVVSRNTTPLCYLPDGRLVCYHHGHILVNVNGSEFVIFQVPISKKERYWGWSCLATRLLRLGIRTAIALDSTRIIISIGNRLHEFDTTTGKLSEGWVCGEGVRPLIFTEVKDIEGFEDGIYFGGYLGNMEKKPVNIYHRTGEDQWEVVYTFPQGAINHVHNIVADTYRKCLWAFTGDFGEAAAIWKITEGFKKVERVVSNNQMYRGCVVFALPEGLLYATDAPFADNYIYLLKPSSMEFIKISPIHGSCIYGCKWRDKYVFSSTVEADGRNMNKRVVFFTRKKGRGIKDNFVHLYLGDTQEGFREIYSEKKDVLPFFTFQFGVFKFPAGVNNSHTLFFQPVATTKNDMALLRIEE